MRGVDSPSPHGEDLTALLVLRGEMSISLMRFPTKHCHFGILLLMFVANYYSPFIAEPIISIMVTLTKLADAEEGAALIGILLRLFWSPLF